MSTRPPVPMAFPRRRVALAVIAVLFLISLNETARLSVDALWFQELGALQVFTTRLQQQALFAAAAFVVAFAVLALAALRVLRRGPALRWGNRGEVRIEPSDRRARPFVLAAAAMVAFFFAAPVADRWLDLRLAFAHQPYGIRDPVFGRDVGDYVFVLPAVQFATNWFLMLAAMALAATVALESGFVALTSARALSPGAVRGIGIWLGVLLLLACARLGIAQYDALYSTHGAVYGPAYTDVQARLPAMRLVGAACAVAAGLVFFGAWRQRVRWLFLAPAALAVLAVVALGIVPALVQRLLVEPNEFAKEKPYLENSIRMTRAAYDLDTVKSRPATLDRNLDAGTLARHRDLLDNIRLWDWQPLLATYSQLQEIRLYYNFHDVDIDRYPVQGGVRQVMLSARELAYDQLPEGARTWVNLHLRYTHGYGLCMSPVNHVTSEGLPELWVRDIPPAVNTVDLRIDRPEIYFGEQTDTFALVGTSTDEFDYPIGDSNQSTRYAGKGGIAVGSFGRRLLFAWALQSREMLLTRSLTPESKILLRRSLADRAPRIAPFLRYDSDPYLVVAEGRLFWVQDAYTVSSRFPGSRPAGRINTIRNAVKVVVDAYDGTTTFYAALPADPLLRAYAQVFPGLFKPLETMPAGVMAHLRFPEDLFAVQAQVLATYHMQDPQAFYNREDLWSLPLENAGGREVVLEPYYAMMQIEPGGAPEFVLMQPFTPSGKDNMIAWLVARCDGTGRGERIVSLFPKQELVYGPRQIEARIDQDATISQLLTLWNQRGSSVVRGTLTVLPLGNTLLYVESLYLQAEKGALPELKRVIVAYSDRIDVGENLQAALARRVGEGVGLEPAASTPGLRAAPGSALEAGETPQRAMTLLRAAESALQRGDWVEHGRVMQELRQLLETAASPPRR